MNDEYLTNEIGPEIKRVTLHPLDADGNPDTEVNLYPKTLLDGIVDREGNEVDVALKEDLPTSDDFVTLDTDQVIGGYKRFSSTLSVGDEIQPQILIDGNSSDINIFKDTTNYITYDVEGIYGCINEGSQNCNLTFPKKTGILATTNDIPTNYVTTDTYQNISGSKSFTNRISFGNKIQLLNDSGMYTNISGEGISNAGIKITYEDSYLDLPTTLILGNDSYFGTTVVLGKGQNSSREDIAYIKRTSKEGGEALLTTAYLLIPNKGTEQNPETLATIGDIPTNYVTTTDSDQAIFGNKTFHNQTDFVSQVNIWGDAHITTIKNGDGNYGLLVPGTTSYTANKTIATIEDCGTKLYVHHITVTENSDATSILYTFDVLSTDSSRWSTDTQYSGNPSLLSTGISYYNGKKQKSIEGITVTSDIIILGYEYQTLKLCFIDEDGALQSIPVSSDFFDTVTEL